MTNEALQTAMSENHHKLLSFGIRLQTAREALGMDRKEVAAQLRLSEKTIVMLEEDQYPKDLPATFIRGYLRSYSKLVGIPEMEVKDALAPLQPKPLVEDEPMPIHRPEDPVTSSNFFVQFITYLIILTVAGLTGMWWYNHTAPNNSESSLVAGTEQLVNNRGPRNTSDTLMHAANPVVNEELNNQTLTALAAAQIASDSMTLDNQPKLSKPAEAIRVNVPHIPKPASLKPNPETILTKKNFETFVTANSQYDAFNAFSDFSMFAMLGLIAFWLYMPRQRAVKTAQNMARKETIRKLPAKKQKHNNNVFITVLKVIAVIFQDLCHALASKRGLILLSGLGIAAIIGGVDTVVWKDHESAPSAPVVATVKPLPPSRMQVITQGQLNHDPILISLAKFNSAPNDGAFNHLIDPQMMVNKIVSYVKNPPTDAVPTETATPETKIVARKTIQTHHSVPAYIEKEDADSDDNDASDD